MTRLPALLVALACAALLAAAAAPAAHGAPAMEVGVADDRLLFEGPEQAATTVAEWRASGVDAVRIFARWGTIAPAPNDLRPPAGFDAADPGDPAYDWRALDRAVTGAGMRVVLTVTGWGPVWGTQFPVKRNPRHKPDPARFAAFAEAVARRYGPLVDRYIVWNEPNVALWLQPQSACSAGGRCTPAAPHLYRRLFRAAEPAIRAADPGAQVMAGALAPRGSSGTSANANLRPLVFLRAMGCVSRAHRRVRTGECRGFRPLTADLLAHHPHGLKLAPAQPDRMRDHAQLADLGRLTAELDRVQRAGGIRSRGGGRLPLYLDEYAYQTDPPDRVLGVSPARQAAWLQQAAYLAWRHPRVRGLTWYVWRDEPLAAGSGGWQSGVRFADGRAKPALAAFARPVHAFRRGRATVRVWGQVRPGGRHRVAVQRRSGSAWRTVADVATDARGAFQRDLVARGPATVRFVAGGEASAAATVR
jgi:hypothetical protein